MKSMEEDILRDSDCVTEEALKRYAFDRVSSVEKRMIELHLAGCDMCSDMAEGFRLYKNEEHFEEDLQAIRNKLLDKGKVIPLYPIRRYLSIAAVLVIILGSAIFISRMMQEQDRREREVADAGVYKPKNAPAIDSVWPEKNPAEAEKIALKETTKGSNAEPVKNKAIVMESMEKTVSAESPTDDLPQEVPVSDTRTGEVSVAEDVPGIAMTKNLTDDEAGLIKSEAKDHEAASRTAAVPDLLNEEVSTVALSRKTKAQQSRKVGSEKAETRSEAADAGDFNRASGKIYELYQSGRKSEAAKMAASLPEDGGLISYLKAISEKKDKNRAEALFRSVQSNSEFYRESRLELGRLMKARGADGWESVIQELSRGQDSTARKSRELLRD